MSTADTPPALGPAAATTTVDPGPPDPAPHDAPPQGRDDDPLDALRRAAGARASVISIWVDRFTDRVAVPLLARFGRLPPWVQALAVYAVTRLLAVLFTDRTARFQEASLWTVRHPDYWGMVGIWDGSWYKTIATEGYPRVLPRGDDGLVQQNPWAFYPLYPGLVRSLMAVTGLGWPIAGSIVAVLAGAAAMVVLRSLVAHVAGDSAGLWTVVLVCCWPAAPILQFTYTESLGLFVMALCLLLLQRRMYHLLVPALLVAGLTRPMGVPLAAVVGWHVLRGAVAAWRTPGRRGEWIGWALSLVAAAAGALEWPVIAALVTGESDAYTQTEVAWRTSHTFTPFKPWWDMSAYVLGGHLGRALLILLVLLTAWWLLSRPARIFAGEIRDWAVWFSLYLFAVVDPFTSLARWMMPLFPFAAFLVVASRSRAYRVALALAFLAGQVVWVFWLWRFSPPSDWAP